MTLQDILSPFGIHITEEQIQKLDEFYKLLIEWNEKMNLTAITEKDEVIVKHFADSILGLPYFEGSVCDVGAGAGFPSVPLAITGVKNIVTADSLAKRITFLEEVKKQLDLDIYPLHIRAEDLGKSDKRESFDTVTARAVANTSTLVEYLLPLVKVCGKAVLYKGGEIEEELKEAEEAVKILGGKIKTLKKYEFCSLSRTLVIIEKIKPTPKAYPRTGNKPKTQPIKAK